MYKFNNSILSFEEWIRLNDIDTPHILEAADIIADQESIITEQEQEIEQLIMLINSFDFKTIDVELNWIEQSCTSTSSIHECLVQITGILDNYKLRIKDI